MRASILGMIPKVCFVCGDEHPRRKTKRYIVKVPPGSGRKAAERAAELCKEHAEPLEEILQAPARGTKHTLKVYKSYAEFERAEKRREGRSTQKV